MDAASILFVIFMLGIGPAAPLAGSASALGRRSEKDVQQETTIAAVAMVSKRTRGIERCISQRLSSQVVLSIRNPAASPSA